MDVFKLYIQEAFSGAVHMAKTGSNIALPGQFYESKAK